MDRAELRSWITDALTRYERDARDRGEDVASSTVPEVVDAVWGRLPLEVRRTTTRADVQASLTMLSLRHGIAAGRAEAGAPASIEPGTPIGTAPPAGSAGATSAVESL